jgi:branched-chain amino acid transport system permease protein
MDSFVLQVTAGLANGGIYAAVGLALVMIHQATHHINFAQGEMATFSTFIAWAMIQAGVPYWIAFVVTMVVSFVAGLLIQRIFL